MSGISCPRWQFSRFLPLLLSAISAVSLPGQATTLGSIVGSVFDGSNSSVPNARVRVTNAGTAISRELTTNDAGFFQALSLIGCGQYNSNSLR